MPNHGVNVIYIYRLFLTVTRRVRFRADPLGSGLGSRLGSGLGCGFGRFWHVNLSKLITLKMPIRP